MTAALQWSPQQDKAIQEARAWIKSGSSQVFTIQGFAGTGKTTIAKEIAANLKGDVAYGAFTGKAASVMRRKGCDEASTIHGLIYRRKGKDRPQPRFEIDHNSVVKFKKLVIIDECSMVDDELGRDLLSFGTKILVLGDPAQLPPIKGTGFFNTDSPDIMLTEIHRQALDNPIIRLSMQVREGGKLEPGNYGESTVIERKGMDPDDLGKRVMAADQVIVGLNRTRHQYNRRMRSLKGIESEMPVKNEKLVCLRNDNKISILNGTLWQVKNPEGVDDKLVSLQLKSLEDATDQATRDVVVREEFFRGTEGTIEWRELKGTQQFTYGYALTCHKSQGSQWDNVMIFDEGNAFRDDAIRWRYTAITRAAEKVTMVV